MADEVPSTMTAQRIQEAMDSKGLSIKDVADRAETTYEHVRKIIRGGSFPSKYMIRVLCDILDIKKSELDQLVVADQIRHKYGKIPALLAGKNPELEPVERLWNHLTGEQKDTFIAQMEAVVKKNRRDRVAATA